MKYTDATAFRQALEAQLRTRSGSDGSLVARNRKRVAFDRLLARLVLVAPQRWRLKGGFALELRFGERARATKDVDIQWHGDGEELLDALIDVADRDIDDFFSFAIERSSTPPDRLGGSHRFTVTASLAGRTFEAFVLDVAISPTAAAAEPLATHDLLAFADMPAVRVHAIPLETQIAEKVHAYTRRYRGDRPSSRAKDLVDLVLIAELKPSTQRQSASRSTPPSTRVPHTRRRKICPNRRPTGRPSTDGWQTRWARRPTLQPATLWQRRYSIQCLSTACDTARGIPRSAPGLPSRGTSSRTAPVVRASAVGTTAPAGSDRR